MPCAVTAMQPQADVERVVEILLSWIEEDRKATPLKALQGMVWAQGYHAGQLKGHVYPDAVEALHAGTRPVINCLCICRVRFRRRS